MSDNACNRESSRESFQTGLSAFKSTRGRRAAADVQRDLFDLYEVLEAYAPVWYSSKLRRGLLAAVKALDTRR